MTKENKLALVVGFALILFVGILISDHFSTTQRQQIADLRPIDPLENAVQGQADLIDYIPAPSQRMSGTVSSPTRKKWTTAAGLGQVAMNRDEQTIHLPDLQALNQRSQNQTTTGDNKSSIQPYDFHDVQRGESLAAICRSHYGDDSLAPALARYNNITNPNSLSAGRRLILPAISQMRGSISTSPSRPARSTIPARQPQPTFSFYTIKRGDLLSVIAQRELGSAKKWPMLHELNRDVIPDPDHLKVGAKIRLPRAR